MSGRSDLFAAFRRYVTLRYRVANVGCCQSSFSAAEAAKVEPNYVCIIRYHSNVCYLATNENVRVPLAVQRYVLNTKQLGN